MLPLIAAIILFCSFATTASASLSGPVFQDFAILPSSGGVNTQLASQSLVVDGSATSFTFLFSLSNPSQYLSGALSINFTRPSDSVTVALSQNFSYDFPVDSSVSSFSVTVFLFESPCTTPPSCNNTYLIHATRNPLQESSNNSYTLVILLACILGGTIILMLGLLTFSFLVMKKMSRTEEQISLTDTSA